MTFLWVCVRMVLGWGQPFSASTQIEKKEEIRKQSYIQDNS